MREAFLVRLVPFPRVRVRQRLDFHLLFVIFLQLLLKKLLTFRSLFSFLL